MLRLLIYIAIMAISTTYASERLHQPFIIDQDFAAGDAENPTVRINANSQHITIGNNDAPAVDSCLTTSGNTTHYIHPDSGHLTVRKSTDGSQIFDIDQATQTISANTNIAAQQDTHVTGSININGNAILGNNALTINGATGRSTFTGDVGIQGRIAAGAGLNINSSNFMLDGKLLVTGSSNLDSTLVMQDQHYFGTNVLPDASLSTTEKLLKLTLPNEPYIGTVQVTYCGDIFNKNTQQTTGLEIFTAKYLISRMDLSHTATVKRLSDAYYNHEGSLIIPENSGSEYALSLDADYHEASLWTPDPSTVYINFLSPTNGSIRAMHQSVMYDIKSGISLLPTIPSAPLLENVNPGASVFTYISEGPTPSTWLLKTGDNWDVPTDQENRVLITFDAKCSSNAVVAFADVSEDLFADYTIASPGNSYRLVFGSSSGNLLQKSVNGGESTSSTVLSGNNPFNPNSFIPCWILIDGPFIAAGTGTFSNRNSISLHDKNVLFTTFDLEPFASNVKLQRVFFGGTTDNVLYQNILISSPAAAPALIPDGEVTTSYNHVRSTHYTNIRCANAALWTSSIADNFAVKFKAKSNSDVHIALASTTETLTNSTTAASSKNVRLEIGCTNNTKSKIYTQSNGSVNLAATVDTAQILNSQNGTDIWVRVNGTSLTWGTGTAVGINPIGDAITLPAGMNLAYLLLGGSALTDVMYSDITILPAHQPGGASYNFLPPDTSLKTGGTWNVSSASEYDNFVLTFDANATENIAVAFASTNNQMASPSDANVEGESVRLLIGAENNTGSYVYLKNTATSGASVETKPLDANGVIDATSSYWVRVYDGTFAWGKGTYSIETPPAALQSVTLETINNLSHVLLGGGATNDVSFSNIAITPLTTPLPILTAGSSAYNYLKSWQQLLPGSDNTEWKLSATDKGFITFNAKASQDIIIALSSTQTPLDSSLSGAAADHYRVAFGQTGVTVYKGGTPLTGGYTAYTAGDEPSLAGKDYWIMLENGRIVWGTGIQAGDNQKGEVTDAQPLSNLQFALFGGSEVSNIEFADITFGAYEDAYFYPGSTRYNYFTEGETPSTWLLETGGTWNLPTDQENRVLITFEAKCASNAVVAFSDVSDNLCAEKSVASPGNSYRLLLGSGAGNAFNYLEKSVNNGSSTSSVELSGSNPFNDSSFTQFWILIDGPFIAGGTGPYSDRNSLSLHDKTVLFTTFDTDAFSSSIKLKHIFFGGRNADVNYQNIQVSAAAASPAIIADNDVTTSYNHVRSAYYYNIRCPNPIMLKSPRADNFYVTFKARASSDVHIALTSSTETRTSINGLQSNDLGLVIGGYQNTKSWITGGSQLTETLLNKDAFVDFWIRIQNGTFSWGTGTVVGTNQKQSASTSKTNLQYLLLGGHIRSDVEYSNISINDYQIAANSELPLMEEKSMSNVTGTLWSPNGSLVAISYSNSDMKLHTRSGKTMSASPVSTITGTCISSLMSWSPDGLKFAVARNISNVPYLQTYELSYNPSAQLTAKASIQLTGLSTTTIDSITWSPDSQRVAIGGRTSSKPYVYLYDIAPTSLTPTLAATKEVSASAGNCYVTWPSANYLAIGYINKLQMAQVGTSSITLLGSAITLGTIKGISLAYHLNIPVISIVNGTNAVNLYSISGSTLTSKGSFTVNGTAYASAWAVGGRHLITSRVYNNNGYLTLHSFNGTSATLVTSTIMLSGTATLPSLSWSNFTNEALLTVVPTGYNKCLVYLTHGTTTKSTVLDTAFPLLNSTAVSNAALDWSPNGSVLAMSDATKLYLYTFDPTQFLLTQVTSVNLAGIDDITWRPDGAYLAVRSPGTGVFFSSYNKTGEVHSLNFENQLDWTDHFHCSWSSNGQKILLVTQIQSKPVAITYNINTSGGLSISSDASGLVWDAVQAYSAFFGIWLSPTTIAAFWADHFRIGTISGTSINFPQAPVSATAIINFVQMSPNGSYVAVGVGGNSLRIYTNNGSALTLVKTFSIANLKSASWTADSQYVMAGSSSNLYCYKAEGASTYLAASIATNKAMNELDWGPVLNNQSYIAGSDNSYLNIYRGHKASHS